MSKRLFEDFPAVSTEDWMARIGKDLKGRPTDSLRWTNEDGIDLFPVFRKEDLPDPEWLQANFPGMSPYLRGDQPLMHRNQSWEIRHDFRAESVQANVDLIRACGDEIQGIGLVLGLPFREFLFDWKEKELPVAHPRDGIYLHNFQDFDALLRGIDWTGKQIHLRAGHAALPMFAYLTKAWKQLTGLGVHTLHGSLDADPFNRLGSDPSNEGLLELLLDDTAAILQYQADRGMNRFRSLRISLEPHHFMGANGVQQIASALSMAAEYVDLFEDRYGLEPEHVLRNIHFSFPIDTDFFANVAKLRAFRWLFGRMISAYELDGDLSDVLHLHGHGAVRSQSVLDQEVNLLRGTTQAMSAIMGGCHSVSLPAYNALHQNDDAHAIRIARNIQLILREESWLDKVIDPAGGSYYVEYLTARMGEMAWNEFLAMEKAGGYLASWRKGELPSKLVRQRQALDQQVATGKYSLLGVNQYPNLKDEVPTLLTTGYVRDYPLPERDYLAMSFDRRVDAVEEDAETVDLGSYLEAQLVQLDGRLGRTGELVRLGEAFENLRRNATEYIEDGFDPPKAFLWTFGPLTMRKARAAFSRNLLGCGGFEAVENPHSDDAQAALQVLATENPQVVVLCSDDATALAKGKELAASIRQQLPEARIVLAGKPEGWEELGVDHVVYSGMDRVAFLRSLQEETKIVPEDHYEA